MKRIGAVALGLAACASPAATDDVPSALRGCWIERRGADTLTMRWFPQDNLTWRGDLLHYAPNIEPEPQHFSIVATAGEREQWGWALCPHEEPTDPPCRASSFGGATIEDGADIEVTGERLRVRTFIGREALVLFDGARDGCD